MWTPIARMRCARDCTANVTCNIVYTALSHIVAFLAFKSRSSLVIAITGVKSLQYWRTWGRFRGAGHKLSSSHCRPSTTCFFRPSYCQLSHAPSTRKNRHIKSHRKIPMDKIKAFFGGGGPKAPAFTPLPDRKPDVSNAQRSVPRSYRDIPERVLIHTTMGDITVSLFREQTPKVGKIVERIKKSEKTSSISIPRHAQRLTSLPRHATTSPLSPPPATTTPSPATASSATS